MKIILRSLALSGQGYRDHPRAAIEEIALTLVKLSQLVCDLDEVVEIDLNPLLVDAESVTAVDARIRLESRGAARGNRLAIRPYPKELELREHLSSIGAVQLRPIRPEDAPPLAQLIADLTPEDARFRFFTPLRSVDPTTLARFTQIDYDREMALVAYAEDVSDRLLAVVRLAADPDNIRAEFAIVVRSDMHRHGLGRLLLAHLIEYARTRGISELFGDVLTENQAMLALCAQLGFTVSATESTDVLRATLAP